ncbi:MAG: DUF805 domain-containing protein [Kineosporiaceae bacterium]
MSFPESIRTVLTKYAVFTGRARRSEYWWFALFLFLLQIVTSIVDNVAGTTVGEGVTGTGVITSLVGLALLLPSLGVQIRRLHDTGRSGWWVLIGLIPLVGAIVLIVFSVQDGHPGENAHGPNPKGLGATPLTA